MSELSPIASTQLHTKIPNRQQILLRKIDKLINTVRPVRENMHHSLTPVYDVGE